MQIPVSELCKLVNGKIEGNAEVLISGPAKIEDAASGTISFIANSKYQEHAFTTKASAILADEKISFDKKLNCTLIRVKDVYSSFAIILQKFNEVNFKTGIEEPSFISKTAIVKDGVYVGAFAYIGEHVTLEKNAKVFPHCYIGNSTIIGENSIIFSSAKIYNNSVIGNNCIIHSGAIIGSDGFGFAPQGDGSYKKIPQVGNVVIEDNVEIGANTTIDRATMGSTYIRKGVKLDNLIQIAHNVEIGENTVIAAQTGVSGSTKLGRQCIIGGQVGFVGHINIADGTRVNAQSGVSKNIVAKNKAWNGAPAFDYNESLRSQVIFKKLPELEKRLTELEQTIESTEKIK